MKKYTPFDRKNIIKGARFDDTRFILPEKELNYLDGLNYCDFNFLNFARSYQAQCHNNILFNNGSLAVKLAKGTLLSGWHTTSTARYFTKMFALRGGLVAKILIEKTVKESYWDNWSSSFGASHYDTLAINNGEIALRLAKHSDKNNWALNYASQQLEVLGLREGMVGLLLWQKRHFNGWLDTPAGKNYDKVVKIVDSVPGLKYFSPDKIVF